MDKCPIKYLIQLLIHCLIEDSVTDAWGRVHGVPGLFVADASLFPRAAGINPYVTVMALADRVAERVRREARELRASARL